MMQHGCMGYLTKNTDQKTLITAIEQIHSGTPYVEPKLNELLLKDMTKANIKSTKMSHLTKREKEILQLIAAELTSQEIADKLLLSLRTVESHRISMIQKLGVKNSIGLVKVAMQLGLLD